MITAFQCPEGHCLHCYGWSAAQVGDLRPGFSAPKGIVFIATWSAVCKWVKPANLVSVPRRALSSLLPTGIEVRSQCHAGQSFSAPKGIVFIATLSSSARSCWQRRLRDRRFQCPEGHCLHCYEEIEQWMIAEERFQCPEGHCLHCYGVHRCTRLRGLPRVSVPRRALSSLLPAEETPAEEAAEGFSAPKGIVFIATGAGRWVYLPFNGFSAPKGIVFIATHLRRGGHGRKLRFSAPKGIVFIATAAIRRAFPAPAVFQCPEGHCLHCYVKMPCGSYGRCILWVSVPRRALSSLLPTTDLSRRSSQSRFQCPEGHCLHCYC